MPRLVVSAQVIQGQDRWSTWCCLFMGKENICVCRLLKGAVFPFQGLGEERLDQNWLHFILEHRYVSCQSHMGCRVDALLR